MRKIYIDVTNLLMSTSVTGIQRVVINVTTELLKTHYDQIHLLMFSLKHQNYVELNKKNYFSYYSNLKKTSKLSIITNDVITFEAFNKNDIFFDLDSAWASSQPRSWLLPILKQKGVICVVYIYDIIPIQFPSLCHIRTVNTFMNYFGAYLNYGDFIITSANSVLKEIHQICKDFEIPVIPGDFSWLGSDFHKKTVKSQNPDKKVKEIIENQKYVLFVGTIEPRKNISFLLDAFDKVLFEQSITLVLVGKEGWNVSDTIKRIHENPFYNKQLFQLQGINDYDLDILYQNASAVVFPSYDEGFGLPVVEAFERNTPVISSDRPVLREVGQNLADYFPLDKPEEFIDLVMKYSEDAEYRDNKIKQIRENYTPVSWKTVSEKIWTLLNSL